jgi:predicted phosphate transport protein (TIGR00153 family)
MTILFKRTRALEAQIELFLEAVSEGCLVFELGVADYMRGDWESFDQHRRAIGQYEGKADVLRREVETRLYAESLIPDHRGDVLGLLESLDNVIDEAKRTLSQFEVERPEIPADLVSDYLTLAHACVESTQHLIFASRAFFGPIASVPDHIHKVYFYEKEADRLADGIKRKVFGKDLELARKIHLRYFCLHIENVSDRAEEVADRLAIYAIKRTV